MTIKTVIAIILWIGSIMGLYFKMNSDLDAAKLDIVRLESRLDKYDPAVLDTKITDMQTQLTTINSKADDIEKILAAHL